MLALTDMVFRCARSRACLSLVRRSVLSHMGNIETCISLSPCPVGKDFDRSLALLDLVTALEKVPFSLITCTLLPLSTEAHAFFRYIDEPNGVP